MKVYSLLYPEYGLLQQIASIPPLDPNAAAYLAAANIAPGQIYPGNGTTDYPFKSERIISYTNSMFLALKAANLYSRIVVMYPFMGATNADAYVNAINPGTNNLTPVGTVTAGLVRLGFAFDAASVLNTGVLLSQFAQDSMTTAYYYNKISGGYDWGCQPTISGTIYGYGPSLSANAFNVRQAVQYVNPLTTTIPNTSYGLTVFTFPAVNTAKVYNRGTLNATGTGTDASQNTAYNSYPVYIGNYSGNSGGDSVNTCGLFFMMDGATQADVTSLTSIFEQWAFGVGRNQGGIIYNAFQFFGDSITAGELASPIYHAWITNVSYNEAATQVSWAVPGTTIGDCNSTAILNLVPKGNGYTKVFLAFNTNDVIDDIMSSGTTYNLSVFTTNYVAVLGKFLTAGYSPSDICTVLGYYNNLGAQYDSYNAYIEAYPGGAEALQDAYIAAAATASANAGISNAFNLKPVMIAAGGNALLSGIHPNNAGHDVIGNYLSANLVNF